LDWRYTLYKLAEKIAWDREFACFFAFLPVSVPLWWMFFLAELRDLVLINRERWPPSIGGSHIQFFYLI